MTNYKSNFGTNVFPNCDYFELLLWKNYNMQMFWWHFMLWKIKIGSLLCLIPTVISLPFIKTSLPQLLLCHLLRENCRLLLVFHSPFIYQNVVLFKRSILFRMCSVLECQVSTEKRKMRVQIEKPQRALSDILCSSIMLLDMHIHIHFRVGNSE